MASSSALRASLRSEKQITVRSSGAGHGTIRSKLPPSKRSVAAGSRVHINEDDAANSGRVRVAVRLRPRNTEDLASEADFADCVELQPELKRLKLRKNNWSSESFKFDEVFTESASQRRVYEVVAKPVVESVLDGYNGTVMAYGQTGTGKTYTVGQLGKDDPSERGIMVRALEEILASTSPTTHMVSISYLQLYLESVQDLLVPENNDIPITEDPKSGEVFLSGAEVVRIRGVNHFLQLLEIGEGNRHAANTNLNTESSRSHAILMVYVQKYGNGKGKDGSPEIENHMRIETAGNSVPIVLRSKLLIVDLAGSERIDKTGSEGHALEEAKFINLSLSSLGKCINALAENSPHIPTRDSKLTRLLRGSFGGSARTSLIITIGPSALHLAEATSTIMFGQRAMKIVNILKLKEEFDYESMCRKLEHQVDSLTAEIERQSKLRENEKQETKKMIENCENKFAEAERNFTAKYEQQQLESCTYQKVLSDTTQMYESKITELMELIKYENERYDSMQEELDATKKLLTDYQRLLQIEEQKQMIELETKLEEVHQLHEKAVNKLNLLKEEKEELLSGMTLLSEELHTVKEKLSNEEKKRNCLEDELSKWKKLASEKSFYLEDKKSSIKDELGGAMPKLVSPKSLHKAHESMKNLSFGQKVDLSMLLASLRSTNEDVQIHALKVVANLAAEDSNQEKIVEGGGLDSLLMLLESSQNTTIHRVASGAIANLAMNEMNQGLIVSKRGIRLLANIASRTDDPQTLRMVAGAVANLCGNAKSWRRLLEG
ncbi:kinesin-like protein KIN-UC isoform X2 [Aristolochia californica]|uniref:kinesin-like protein KIN-UC isoform X2 n=1 Tax=Aristolochia californica TaxID=171875 RepID=UPI0035D8EE84